MPKPEKTFRIGPCSASVFVNTPKAKDKARSFRSVSLQRRYKSGDTWKSATSFGLSDLPAAIAVLQMAMTHVASKEAEFGKQEESF
ncbi:MAG: hypothetical protein HYS13_17670 [Planctomycetia bacterium]|nr:hypothetical protein [Planctomycetia bacterium]